MRRNYLESRSRLKKPLEPLEKKDWPEVLEKNEEPEPFEKNEEPNPAPQPWSQPIYKNYLTDLQKRSTDHDNWENLC